MTISNPDLKSASHPEQERLRRWRIILGEPAADALNLQLSNHDLSIDRVLSALYDSDREGGLGSSAPSVSRWLGDIRTYFPSSVVQIMQKDALERLNLRQMLLNPELLESLVPDVQLAANLIALSKVIPTKTRHTAKMVVQKVVDEIKKRLASPLRQAVNGSINRASRNRHPRYNEMNWPRTIQANLKHYQIDYKTIIPVNRIGYGRKRAALRKVILCVDQSGSMATSVVYAGILGAVLASIPALKTHVVVFDTNVVDLTEELHDPVELLFGTQLGGGTDINRALAYCQGLVQQPQDTILILISDLYEGGNREEMLLRSANFVSSGVKMITLLALNDDGRPAYDHNTAGRLAAMGIPVFACTPDQFPDLLAVAIEGRSVVQWAATNDIVTTRGLI